jgi:hypothetical protein
MSDKKELAVKNSSEMTVKNNLEIAVQQEVDLNAPYQGVVLNESNINHAELVDTIDNGTRLPVDNIVEYWTLPDDAMEEPMHVMIKSLNPKIIDDTDNDGNVIINKETGEVQKKKVPCTKFYELIKQKDNTILFKLRQSYTFYLHKSFCEIIKENNLLPNQVYDLKFVGRRKTQNGRLAAKFTISPIYRAKTITVE